MNIPKGSDMYTESSVKYLDRYGLNAHKTVFDQCRHDAKIDELFIKKGTELWSNEDIEAYAPELAWLCQGDH